MTDIDIFGNILDADTVEGYVRSTLQAWIVAHLAHQERRRDLDPGTLKAPRTWPTISEFDLDAHEQMPAIVLVSPGTGTPTHDRGVYAVPWRIEIAVAVAGRDEFESRLVAALYLAAVKGSIIQNRTLGGTVEKAMWVGPDDHAIGTLERGGSRALYATTFEVITRDAVSARLGPEEPPPDPYDPPEAPAYPNEAEILVTATTEEP